MPSQAASIPDLFLHRARVRDHDELASLVRGLQCEFIQPDPGAFKAEFTGLRLQDATVQFIQTPLRYVCKGIPSGDRMMFLFSMKMQPEFAWKGQVLDPRAIIFLPPQAEHHKINPANSWCAAVSLERAPLEKALGSLSGSEPVLNLQTSRVLLPEAGAFEALRRRLEAVHAAIALDPSFLTVPEARRGLEESVLSALMPALGTASRVRPAGYGTVTTARVVRQVEEFLSATLGEPLYLADLCAAAGVGERTLRYIFQGRYGISPIRYLKLRRLHQIRRALNRADPDLNTVQSIANRCGIWHLGRFAQEYKSFFRETPLETLSKACLLGERGSNEPRLAGPPDGSLLLS